MALKVGDLIRTPVLGRGLTEHKVITLADYSSGKPHGGIDLGMCPIGTEVRAPFDGTVVARVDGVANNRPGEDIYSGKPSNWILLLVKIRTNYDTVQDATIFFQHLSPGLKVKTGQKVKRGDVLGYSGNSGNSTGPHLHLGAQWVRKGRGYGAATRYDHVNVPDLRIWPPDRFLDLEHLPPLVTTSEADVKIWSDFGGKPAGTLRIGRSYVAFDSVTKAPPFSGIEGHDLYLNVEPVFADGKDSGVLRVKYERAKFGKEPVDPTGYKDFVITRDSLINGRFLITHIHREAGEKGRSGRWYVRVGGGLVSATAGTRYAKIEVIG